MDLSSRLDKAYGSKSDATEVHLVADNVHVLETEVTGDNDPCDTVRISGARCVADVLLDDGGNGSTPMSKFEGRHRGAALFAG